MISTLDSVVAIAYLGVTVAVGLWMGRNNRNIDDYLLGGRDLPWWAILGSIVATETSAATLLSVPGTAYREGGDFGFLQLAIGFILGRILVVLLLLPGYFKTDLMTAYQLLETRFGISTRRFASLLFLIPRNLGDGLRLFLTALAMKQAIHLPLTTCILLTGGVTILYTLFGGLRSVVWSDCAQFVIYLFAAIAMVCIIVQRLPGGWSELSAYAAEHDKFRMFHLEWDIRSAYTIWAGIFGGAFLSLASHGVDQMIIQRCLAARSHRDASRAILASGFIVFAQFALVLLIGVGLACFYARFPHADGPLGKDEVFATFMVSELPHGLVGLVVAGIFAAAMSTTSSSLNASTSTLIGDFGSLFDVDRLSAAQRITLSRASTFFFGIVQMAIAAIAGWFLEKSVVETALGIAGFTAGSLLGVFALGHLSFVTERGAIVGMLTGFLVLLAVFNDVAFPWYPVIGSATTLLVGIAVSLPPFLRQPQNFATSEAKTE